MDEQQQLAYWWRDAAGCILGKQDWDLFMLKWHGPDWTNHLTMYMIDPRHPMYEEVADIRVFVGEESSKYVVSHIVKKLKAQDLLKD